MNHVNVVTLGLLLFVACVVAIVTRRIGLPYTIGLVVAGIGLSVAGYRSNIELTPELIFTFLLPPLVFEAALHLKWRRFREEASLVLSLAFGGTLLSAAVVAAGMHWLVGWGWLASLLFGSLIAATDPVSVVAMMKEQDAEPRLRFVMEAESLLNDGAAAVLFGLCVAAAAGASTSAGTIALSFAVTVVGGILCGVVVAGGLLLVAGRADDHLVELTLTVLAAYGSFLIAEAIGVSPVLATLAAGMLVGNIGPARTLTERGGEALIRFWDFAAFLANSVIFLLIGSREAEQSLFAILWPAAIATLLVLAGRAAAIFPIAGLFARSRAAIDGLTGAILFWGGLRGALALALALAIPTTLPEHDVLIGVAFAVVAFSIFIQGATMPFLLRKAKARSGDPQ
ncbi:sodium:proton antiporter [Sphingomonas sp. CGMCC 1.13654]|uniref:Sodium:proton antiporter n=1 Tax=Sphingomonas chungangi TaxID=2683589 RepID=A0A838LD15_9SPHN|nr:sodium:proton antiporter [Sphingomonas chungangi]MBA2936539.1 sodium:proton antiporter [Sphingomonas chungangi]MVW55924.1 sodium:proton antiporter [Sphingomonas chungangi]